MVVRILGINGSPRKYGNTFKMLYVALSAVRDLGGEVKLIHLYDYNIKPCIGCVSDNILACRYPCVIEDDMKKIYDMILECDGFIVATPVYWYSPSTLVKSMLDRLTAFENMIYIDGRSWLEGKVCGIIAVGNDSGTIQTISLMYSVLNSMGALIPPWALAYYHDKGNVLDDFNRIMDAYNVGRTIYLACSGEKVDKWYLYEEVKELVEKAVARARIEAERNYKSQFKERKKEIGKLLEK